jgi:hypothetical protein
MRFLLIALVLFLTASAVFGFDPGPLPGIKIKNALLYLIVLALMLDELITLSQIVMHMTNFGH